MKHRLNIKPTLLCLQFFLTPYYLPHTRGAPRAKDCSMNHPPTPATGFLSPHTLMTPSCAHDKVAPLLFFCPVLYLCGHSFT